MKEEETSFKRREEKARKKASRRALVLPLFCCFSCFFLHFLALTVCQFLTREGFCTELGNSHKEPFESRGGI